MNNLTKSGNRVVPWKGLSALIEPHPGDSPAAMQIALPAGKPEPVSPRQAARLNEPYRKLLEKKPLELASSCRATMFEITDTANLHALEFSPETARLLNEAG